MNYFFSVFASLLLIAGICWIVFIKRWIYWFGRKMHKEEKLTFWSSTAGKVGLWAIRTFGMFWIALALLLFAGILEIELGIPSYVRIVLIVLAMLVYIARITLLHTTGRLASGWWRKIRNNHPDAKNE